MEMGVKYRLAKMTWPEVEQAIDRRTSVPVLMGTIETQDPCSPMGSNTLVAESLPSRVAQRFDCVVISAVPFGHTVLQELPRDCLSASANPL